jgi:putative transposase
MPNNRFHKGMHLLYNGREYVIEGRLPNNDLHLKDIVTNKFFAAPEEMLRDSWFDGQMEFLGDATTTYAQRKAAKALNIDLSALDDKSPRKKELKRRYAYISKIIDLISEGVDRISEEILVPVIQRVHETINDRKRKPHWKTVYYEWYKTYINTGEDVRVLIPHYDRQGNFNRKFAGKIKVKYSEKDLESAQRVADIVDEVINEKYLNPQRLTVKAVYEAVIARVADENLHRTAAEQLPIPKERSIYAVVNQLDEYEVIKARWGKRIADIKCGVYKRGPRPTRPLERVEVDHTKLDLFVIDPVTKMPIGRPTLTLAIDRYTRMILGFYVSFNGAGFLAVSHCLRHAILPKTYVKRLFPDVKNLWECYGIPELTAIDNGPEFHGDGFEDAALQLGTVILYCPVRQPWFKAVVERYFRTLNQQLLHELPGTTFSNIFEREDYDPKKNAIITLDSLLIAIHVFIIDYYSQRKHRGIKDIPAQRWKLATEQFPPTLPSRREELNVLLGEVEHRTIQSNGISIFGLVYNDGVLARLRKGRKGYQFKIKYDPADISLIYIHDPDNDKFIPIPAEDQNYTKGLSLWQHRVIQRAARRKVDGQVDIVELCLTKQRITNIIWREWLKISKSGPRTRMARFLNISQPDYERGAEYAATTVSPSLDQSTAAGDQLSLTQMATHTRGLSDLESAYSPHGRLDPIEVESGEEVALANSVDMHPEVFTLGGQRSMPAVGRKDAEETQNISKRRTPAVTTDSNIDDVANGVEDELDDTGWRTAVLPGRTVA